MNAGNPLKRINWLGLIVVFGLIALWQLVVGMGWISFQYIPTPLAVADSLVDLARDGELPADIARTLSVVVGAWVLAMVAGVLAGLVLAHSRTARIYSMTSIDVLRALPVVALIPVALLIWGPSPTTEIVVAAYVGVWTVAINTDGGIRAINPRLQEVATTLRLNRFDHARKVTLPAAAPEILVSARIALGGALVVVIVTEMLFVPAGLGYGLIEQQLALNPAGMWAYVIVIGAIGYLLNAALVTGSWLLLPGMARELGRGGAR